MASRSVQFAFNTGSFVSDSRKPLKFKRKGGSRNVPKRPPQQQILLAAIDVPHVELVMKRKTWDNDIEMVDSNGDQKRSCSGNGIYLFPIEEVAEVVVAQPREQQ